MVFIYMKTIHWSLNSEKKHMFCFILEKKTTCFFEDSHISRHPQEPETPQESSDHRSD